MYMIYATSQLSSISLLQHILSIHLHHKLLLCMVYFINSGTMGAEPLGCGWLRLCIFIFEYLKVGPNKCQVVEIRSNFHQRLKFGKICHFLSTKMASRLIALHWNWCANTAKCAEDARIYQLSKDLYVMYQTRSVTSLMKYPLKIVAGYMYTKASL